MDEPDVVVDTNDEHENGDENEQDCVHVCVRAPPTTRKPKTVQPTLKTMPSEKGLR